LPTEVCGLASGELDCSLDSVFDFNERVFILSSRETAFSIASGVGNVLLGHTNAGACYRQRTLLARKTLYTLSISAKEAR
jgi:hypothetical protein